MLTTPWHVDVVAPWWSLRGLRWHPDVPPEDIALVPCRAAVGQGRSARGLLYWPDPATKPEHHQPADVLELLLPKMTGVHAGAVVRLDLPASQVDVTRRPDAPAPAEDG